jgi:hypothetical protein
MRKKLLFILLLLVPFLVGAKNVEYEWGKSNGRGMLFLEEKDSKYTIYEESSMDPKITIYESNGKRVSSRYLEDTEEDWMIYGQVQNYYIFSLWYNYYNDGEYYELNPKYGGIAKYDEENDQYIDYYYFDLTEEQQTTMTGDYHLLFELYASNPDNEYKMFVKKNGYIVYKIVNNYGAEPKVYLEVYNKDEEKLLSKKMNMLDDIKTADITEEGIYMVEAEYNHDDESAKYSYVEYNLNGTELSRQDITEEMLKYGEMDEEDLYYYIPILTDGVSNGVIISLMNNQPASTLQACISNPSAYMRGTSDGNYDLCRGYVLGDILPGRTDKKSNQPGTENSDRNTKNKKLEDVVSEMVDIRSNFPVVLIKLKYNDFVDYQITPKVQGEGEIKVVSRSEAGGEVTFEVTPKEGYVLSAVKVTDAAGNVIVFTDYKFTMPSANVTIEAVFVPVNPNTTDVAIMGIIIVGILFAGAAFVYYRKMKWMN